MALKFREAVAGDLTRLSQMAQGVVHAERPFNQVIKDGEPEYYDINELIHSKNVCLMVAEDQRDESELGTESSASGKIIACGYAQVKDSKQYLTHKNHAYLGFMYVEPDYRGQGVISKIMERLFDWTKSQGLEYCYLDVYAQNQAALRAYEKLGFHSSIVEMQLKL